MAPDALTGWVVEALLLALALGLPALAGGIAGGALAALLERGVGLRASATGWALRLLGAAAALALAAPWVGSRAVAFGERVLQAMGPA